MALKRAVCFGSLEVKSTLLLSLLWEKNLLDVGEDTTLSDSNTTEEFVQFIVVPDSELKVSWDDPGFFVVPGSVTSELENLSGEILENGSEVDWGTSANTFSVVTFSEDSVDASNGELKSGSDRAGSFFSFGGGFGHFRLFFGLGSLGIRTKVIFW